MPVGGPGNWSSGGAQHVAQAIERMTEISGGDATELSQRVARALASQPGAFKIGENLQPGSPAIHVRRGVAEVRVERVGDSFNISRVLPGARPPDERFGFELPATASRGQIGEHAGKDRRVKTPWGPMQFFAGDDAGPYAKLPDERVVAATDGEELSDKLHAEFVRMDREA